MTSQRLRTLAAILLSSASIAAFASPVTPTYDEFANLPGATFGGSGIPTNPTAITREGTLTLGLAATQRLSGPNLAHNGAGTYYAAPGTAGSPARATWNFDYYINDTLGLAASGLTFQLLYDFDGGVNTDESELGVWNLDLFVANAGSTFQDSQNLSFGFLSTSIPGFLTAPAATFDPNANGQYSFALVASRNGTELARSAINVDVGVVNDNAVPEPAPLALLALGLGAMLLSRRRR